MATIGTASVISQVIIQAVTPRVFRASDERSLGPNARSKAKSTGPATRAMSFESMRVMELARKYPSERDLSPMAYCGIAPEGAKLKVGRLAFILRL